MIVVIRVDSSSQMGSGHLMRCLTLAEELHEEKKAKVSFICRDLPGNLYDIVTDKGFQLYLLPYDKDQQSSLNELGEHKQWLGASLNVDRDETINVLKKVNNIDLLVVDHYALDQTWETPMRQYAKKIMVIDDLADRKHDCDMLLDQNFFLNPLKRYNNKVPEDCKLMLGPKFALLRREFSIERKQLKRREGKLENIIISMGGSDPNRLTAKLVNILIEYQREADKSFNLRVIVGPANKSFHSGDVNVNKDRVEILKAPANMAEQFAWADLCIGTSGATNWERCALGLPAMVIIDGDNEREIAENLHEAGVVFFYENNNSLKDNVKKGLGALSGQKLKQMSELAIKVADGSEVNKVSYFILEECNIVCQTQ